jgi:ribosomal protein S18 acetylase RimI-like enzyme
MEELRRVIPQTGGWDNFLKSLLYKNIKTLNGENSVLIFRKAFSRDLNSVTDLFSAVIKDMNMNNLFLWNHNYPSRGTIKKDIEKETMYVITLNENIVGAVVLNNKFSKSKNRDVKFSNKALHIHRLCTHPIFQRKNLASDILHLVEKIGFCLGFSALRAEVFPLNTSSYNLFNRLEYRTIGNIEFFNGRAAVFEKVLSTDPKIDTKNVIINKSL